MSPEEFQDWRSRLTRNVRTKIAQCPDEGCECVLWTGAVDRYGYGSFKLKGKVLIIHRYIFERIVGPIPDGHDIDHLCTGHRNCVNTNHHETVTKTENSRRANHRRHHEGYRRPTTKEHT